MVRLRSFKLEYGGIGKHGGKIVIFSAFQDYLGYRMYYFYMGKSAALRLPGSSPGAPTKYVRLWISLLLHGYAWFDSKSILFFGNGMDFLSCSITDDNFIMFDLFGLVDARDKPWHFYL